MTMRLDMFERTLVIAPHPDDEVLGAGGTIARLADHNREVFVAVVTTGRPPTFSVDAVERVQAEAMRAHDYLGVQSTLWLNQPAGALFETAHSAVNASIQEAIRTVAPTTLLIPFAGDIHVDHQLTFLSTMVAARPHQEQFPMTILAYETLSETNWNAPYLTPSFVPNVFVEIGDSLERKLDAMQKFASQVRPFPHERSLEALRALATLRGTTIHRPAAEAFVMVRHVV